MTETDQEATVEELQSELHVYDARAAEALRAVRQRLAKAAHSQAKKGLRAANRSALRPFVACPPGMVRAIPPVGKGPTLEQLLDGGELTAEEYTELTAVLG